MISTPVISPWMATGGVSVAAHFAGLDAIAWLLLSLNVLFYEVLCLLTLIRLCTTSPGSSRISPATPEDQGFSP